VNSRLLVALALGALAALTTIGLLWIRAGDAAPPAPAAASAPEAAEPVAPELSAAPASESVAPARESADEVARKSDLPLLSDLAARPPGKVAEDPAFARKYDAMPAPRRRIALDELERRLRTEGAAGTLGAEEASALSREIAWHEAHPGS
jgi:hypothetical protein